MKARVLSPLADMSDEADLNAGHHHSLQVYTPAK
jgi:hypothetical protein